ncbi:MAG: hypothetical protein AVDCRST_MAG39-2640 [uncultured Sphingomonadaceae bacterium]|uniref:Uncharacterized protein n=1 Tax=uncultured Sphingomonadaceae bacterium TaxID=169976 RepID=A0A6J4THE7_9SPHN|nr:MAG: hypothetical protein AVDCRST_MAG39-2640 [uncultured Sphingomonadaceae bacterium]
MTGATAYGEARLPPAALRGAAGRRVRPATLVLALFLFLGLDGLLLWRFLHFAPPWLYLLAGIALAGLGALLARAVDRCWRDGPTVRSLLCCAAVATLLLLWGGEGRLVYANLDWQVRDAVLRDMVLQPWPFAYSARGAAEVLRAPLGMYLAPALAGKAFGVAAVDVALLVQNSALLALLFALGSALFATVRDRLVALAVFVLFSGADILGQLWMIWRRGRAFADHLEPWADGLQFSSHVTQLFWVPQHALAGWFGALFFLLWRDGRLPVAAFGALLPPLALWSPLSLLGLAPFAAYAGWRQLADRGLDRDTLLLPAGAFVLSIPALLYLTAAGDSVGFRPFPVALDTFLLFQLFEVLPFLLLLTALDAHGRYGAGPFRITAAVLVVAPLVQLGESADFGMRASIPALAVLAALMADALLRAFAGPRPRRARGAALAALLLAGAATPAMELRRAFLFQPPPRPRCSMIGSWDSGTGQQKFGKSTYLAPVDAFPPLLRPAAPAAVPADGDLARCWPKPWRTPR